MMQYVSVIEYLMDRVKVEDLTKEQLENVNTLIPRINQLLEKFGEYRAVSSGFRSMKDHLRIYDEINAKLKAKGLPPKKVPISSKHLSAAAVDLKDSDDQLKVFCVKNTKLLKELGLYMEDPSYTDTWIHLQCIPPKSGNTIFIP